MSSFEQEDFSAVGGVWIELWFFFVFCATWPFARLYASPTEIVIDVLGGKINLADQDVIEIKALRGLPFVASGIVIRYHGDFYERTIYFFSFWGANYLLRGILRAGFVPLAQSASLRGNILMFFEFVLRIFYSCFC